MIAPLCKWIYGAPKLWDSSESDPFNSPLILWFWILDPILERFAHFLHCKLANSIYRHNICLIIVMQLYEKNDPSL
jgi:hypothetical protein